MKIEVDRETDGRWIADIPELPGCMAYGPTEEEAVENVRRLADEIRESDGSAA